VNYFPFFIRTFRRKEGLNRAKYPQLALIALIIFSAFSCTRDNKDEIVAHHDQIVAQALKDVPLLRAFKERFPESKHFVSNITGQYGPPTWNSATPLYGRYVFWMIIPVSIDHQTFKVYLDGDPSFYLHEITAIGFLPGGRQNISVGDDIHFDAKMSMKLRATNWNFETLGIKLKKNQPVPGFSNYVAY